MSLLCLTKCTFQFTHPVRGATVPRPASRKAQPRFNSRTPCGVRRSRWLYSFIVIRFQFTHPVRGATDVWRGGEEEQDGFNSRTPCGVRPQLGWVWYHDRPVSIHAPRAGCDTSDATDIKQRLVSIHAPRAGCDAPPWRAVSWGRSFNSRTPCGVRHLGACLRRLRSSGFNSRTPCGVRLALLLCAL